MKNFKLLITIIISNFATYFLWNSYDFIKDKYFKKDNQEFNKLHTMMTLNNNEIIKTNDFVSKLGLDNKILYDHYNLLIKLYNSTTNKEINLEETLKNIKKENNNIIMPREDFELLLKKHIIDLKRFEYIEDMIVLNLAIHEKAKLICDDKSYVDLKEVKDLVIKKRNKDFLLFKRKVK